MICLPFPLTLLYSSNPFLPFPLSPMTVYSPILRLSTSSSLSAHSAQMYSDIKQQKCNNWQRYALIVCSSTLHKYLQTCPCRKNTHGSHVMWVAPRAPDKWNLSVGLRYTEHHRGSLSSHKSTKPQSRATVTKRCLEYMHSKRACFRNCAPKHIKPPKKPLKNPHTHTHKATTTFWFWHAMTEAQLDGVLFCAACSHILLLSRKKKKKTVTGILGENRDKSLNYLISSSMLVWSGVSVTLETGTEAGLSAS